MLVDRGVGVCGTNTTISLPINMNVSDGSHVLYMYSNNSYDLSSKAVNFYVNTSKLIIHYENYRESVSTNSTFLPDFDLYAELNVVAKTDISCSFSQAV